MTDADALYSDLYRTDAFCTTAQCKKRFDHIANWVIANVPKDASILEFSAGRGGLLQMLIDAGYTDVIGTENASAVWDTLTPTIAEKMIHMDAATIVKGFKPWQDYPFDCVISSDVIEHLPTHYEAVDLMRGLAGICRTWFVITIGINQSMAGDYLPGRTETLHPLSKDAGFWCAFYNELAEGKKVFEDWPSLYMFGTKKG